MRKFILILLFISFSSFAQEQSAFVPSHSEDKCIKEMNQLINTQKIGQLTVHNLLTELTTSFSFQGSTPTCEPSKENYSEVVKKFKEYFYSDRGISFDEFKKIYNVGLKHLSVLKKKKDLNKITQKQVCDAISSDDSIIMSVFLDDPADQAMTMCKKLQHAGFSCGRSLSKEDYFTFLQKLEQSINHLNSIDVSSYSQQETDEFMDIMMFTGGTQSLVEVRIADLAPEKSDKLKVTSKLVNDHEVINIHMNYTKDKTFPTDKNWSDFSKKFKQAIESFWKNQDFTVTVDEVDENSPLTWKIGNVPESEAIALGVTNTEKGYLGFQPQAIDNSVLSWKHEFGHVLGFGEAYGPWLESKNDECYIGLFNDITNVMNNTAEESGKLIPALKPQQIKSIVTTYSSDANLIDQKIYELRHYISKTEDEIVEKAKEAQSTKELDQKKN